MGRTSDVVLRVQIETGHLDNPYHNATHVADVVQSMHCILTKVAPCAPVLPRPPATHTHTHTHTHVGAQRQEERR